MNVARPREPVLVGSCVCDGVAIVVQDTFAYTAAGAIRITNIARPDSPFVAATITAVALASAPFTAGASVAALAAYASVAAAAGGLARRGHVDDHLGSGQGAPCRDGAAPCPPTWPDGR